MQGTYVIKVSGPEGWSWNPDKVMEIYVIIILRHSLVYMFSFTGTHSLNHTQNLSCQVPVTVDASGCNRNEDINFRFTGFVLKFLAHL